MEEQEDIFILRSRLPRLKSLRDQVEILFVGAEEDGDGVATSVGLSC